VTRCPGSAGEAGFTLVEAVVALAIVSAITGAFYQLLSSNLAVRQTLADRRMALLVAQSALDLAEVVGPTGAGGSGSAAGYRWKAVALPSPEANSPALRVEQIEVTVMRVDSGRPVLALKTLVTRP
jgi:type II secretion system protein I